MLFTLVCLSVVPAAGQTLEDVLATLQVDEDGDILTDDELLLLEDLVRRPLDINRASRKQLEDVPLLTSTDISLLLSRRKEIAFSAKDQITIIPGLSLIGTQLLPLVTTVKKVVPTKISLRNRWVTSNEDVRLLTQVTLARSNVTGGFILERDPGEAGLSDFLTGYLTAEFKNGTDLILGDHQLHSGYGLLFGRSIRPIKGYGSLTGLSRLGRGLRSYRSSIEYWAMRGVALKRASKWGQLTLSLAASPRDAKVNPNGTVSIFTSGLHRSELSVGRKHNLQETMALIVWEGNMGEAGRYGIILARDKWTVRGSIPGRRLPRTYGSAFGRWEAGRLQFFGEIASHTERGPSFLGGTIVTQENLRWISMVRHYSPGFQGPRSQPFREWSRNELNEMGLYQGLSLRLGKHRFFTYGDVYRQSSSDEKSGRAIRGFETSHTWSYHWRGGLVSLRWRWEEKSNEADITYGMDLPVSRSKRETWRVNSSISFNPRLRIQVQGGGTSVLHGSSTFEGHGLSVKAHLYRDPWRWLFNWVGYATDDYRSRIYIWDINLPGEFRNKTFFPSGQSVAILAALKTATGATLSARVRTTWKFFRHTAQWSKPGVEFGFQMDIAF